jgi:hypothetical protein
VWNKPGDEENLESLYPANASPLSRYDTKCMFEVSDVNVLSKNCHF